MGKNDLRESKKEIPVYRVSSKATRLFFKVIKATSINSTGLSLRVTLIHHITWQNQHFGVGVSLIPHFFLLCWRAVRNFYLPNRLWLLLSNLPLQQNDKAQGVVISVVEDASCIGLA